MRRGSGGLRLALGLLGGVGQRGAGPVPLRPCDLVDACVDRLWIVKGGTVKSHDGDMESYRSELLGRIVTGPLTHELTVGVTHNEREAYSGDSAAAVNVPQNLYSPRDVPVLSPNLTPGNDSQITDRGLYLFDRIALSERWQAMIGARYADYESTTATNRYAATKTSPNVSLLFRPSPDVSLYASYLQGLEETGTAPASRANSGEILPPSVNKQKELGVKARLGGAALLQAALFEIDRPLTTIDGANRFVLGGRSQYRGLELSASGEIGPSWALVASALFLDAEIVSVGAGNAGELGKTPENTPRQTLSLFAEYRVPQVAGLAVSAGAYHVGERMVNNLNQAELDRYTTFSLGTRYATRWAGTPVSLQANLDNATDRLAYSATSILTRSAPGRVPLPGRSLKVGLQASF
mgnify:CR=1 FL=1